jgi:regulator of replication initiation timing
MKNHGEQLKNILKLEPSQQLAKIIELVLVVIEENKHLRLENQQLKNEVSSLKNEVRQLKDEIAILKNQPPRPKIGPSKLEAQPKIGNRKANWSKGSKNNKLVIDEVVKINLSSKELNSRATSRLLFRI